jgi:hypothetical protein
MPLFSENLIAIKMKFTRMIHTYFTTMRLFSQKVSVIFNTPLPMSSKTLYTNAAKLRASSREHHDKFVSVRCHLQNGVHVVHPLQGQTGDSRRAPALGCEQGGEEQCIPFLRLQHVCASWCEASIVVKEKDVCHVSVRTNSTEASCSLFKVSLHRS